MSRALAELGGLWPVAAGLYRLPLIHWLADRVYTLVARNRHWLSLIWGTTPECERPGVRCE